jgi:hypothetical protein
MQSQHEIIQENPLNYSEINEELLSKMWHSLWNMICVLHVLYKENITNHVVSEQAQQ